MLAKNLKCTRFLPFTINSEPAVNLISQQAEYFNAMILMAD